MHSNEIGRSANRQPGFQVKESSRGRSGQQLLGTSARNRGGGMASLKVVAVLVATALAISLAATFVHQHHFLSRVFERLETEVEHGFEEHFHKPAHFMLAANSVEEWERVWEVTRTSVSKEDFLNALRREGLIVLAGSRAAIAAAHVGVPARPSTAAAKAATAAVLAALSVPKQQPPAPLGAAAPAAAGICTAPFRIKDWAPDGSSPELSAKLATAISINGSIIVTWANYALFDFVLTWVQHAKDNGMHNYIVGAMDKQIGDAMVARGINTFSMYERGAAHSGVGSDHLAWGGESFHKMGRQKITLAKLFLDLNLSLLLVDVDAVLLQNVLTYFDQFPQADILCSSDHLMSTIDVGDTGLEHPAKAGSPMNIGIMWFRHSVNTSRFVDVWLDTIIKDDKLWDQLAFNELARAGWDPYVKVHPENSRIFLGWNGSLNVGVLPVAQFSGGHTFFVQKLYEVQRVTPHAVHCTFQYGGNIGKRNRLREARVFADPPEYYEGDYYVMMDLKRVPSTTPRGFLAKNDTEMARYHYKGLDMQLESVWPAMAIAVLANRAIIAPKLACYCDRYWTDLDHCRVPGAQQERLPYLCPMDHVLDPIFMNDDASTLVMRWREHSFLENPRNTEAVTGSKLTVYCSKSYIEVSEKYVLQEGGPVLLLPVGLTSDQLLGILEPYRNLKVWHFKDAAATFDVNTSFTNATLKEAFHMRMNHLKPIQPKSSPPPPVPVTAAEPVAAAADGAVKQRRQLLYGASGGGRRNLPNW